MKKEKREEKKIRTGFILLFLYTSLWIYSIAISKDPNPLMGIDPSTFVSLVIVIILMPANLEEVEWVFVLFAMFASVLSYTFNLGAIVECGTTQTILARCKATADKDTCYTAAIKNRMTQATGKSCLPSKYYYFEMILGLLLPFGCYTYRLLHMPNRHIGYPMSPFVLGVYIFITFDVAMEFWNIETYSLLSRWTYGFYLLFFLFKDVKIFQSLRIWEIIVALLVADYSNNALRLSKDCSNIYYACTKDKRSTECLSQMYNEKNGGGLSTLCPQMRDNQVYFAFRVVFMILRGIIVTAMFHPRVQNFISNLQ